MSCPLPGSVVEADDNGNTFDDDGCRGDEWGAATEADGGGCVVEVDVLVITCSDGLTPVVDEDSAFSLAVCDLPAMAIAAAVLW